MFFGFLKLKKNLLLVVFYFSPHEIFADLLRCSFYFLPAFYLRFKPHFFHKRTLNLRLFCADCVSCIVVNEFSVLLDGKSVTEKADRDDDVSSIGDFLCDLLGLDN